MKTLNATWELFCNDESGQDLVEYALIACLIGLATVSAMSSLAQNIADSFTTIGSTLESYF